MLTSCCNEVTDGEAERRHHIDGGDRKELWERRAGSHMLANVIYLLELRVIRLRLCRWLALQLA